MAVQTMWADYFKTLAILFGILLLAVAAVRLVIPKLTARQNSPFLKVIARYSLEPRKTLCIVQVGSKVLLLASTNQSINYIATLESDEFQNGEQTPQTDLNRTSKFLSLLDVKRKLGKAS